MNWHRIFTVSRDLVGHCLLHPLVIYATIWTTGFLVTLVTGETNAIDLNNNVIYIGVKWAEWLKNTWGSLKIEDYNYLKLKLIAALIAPISCVILYYVKNFEHIRNLRFFEPNEKKVYGDAKWATEHDIRKAGLRSKEGVFIGKDSGGRFVAGGYEHILIFAPTGSGKGATLAIPNLLYWSQSVIVHDIKLENYGITSGWRAKQGDEVYVWEPSNPDGITHCYNPLDWISSKPGQMVDDVQKISNLIMPEKDFWNNEARTLFVGIVLCLIADPSKIRSFGEVTRTIRSEDVMYHLSIVLDTLGKVLHPVAYMNISAFLNKADKERSGVISTMNSSLELWANPLIDTATATSDFNIQEIKRKRTTIFVGLTPDNINRLQKLMQVFYQQCTEFLARKIPNLKEEPYGVLFLLDEFPTLGKMEQFKTGIAYFRGYRVRLMLIVQTTQQLKGLYEEAGMNSFLSNSKYRITFAANDIETAELVSKLVGTQTVEQASYSKPILIDFQFANRTKNVSNTQRALLLAQEVIQLPRDDQIILIESCPPILCKKNWYFKDNFYKSRLLPPTEVPKQEPYSIKKSSDNEEVIG